MHVFDFNEDLYSEEVTTYFIKKLRQERKLDSTDTLIAQITRDIAEAKTVLAEHPDCIDLSL